MSALVLTGLTKSYDGTPVLSIPSMSISAGEFLTLLGPSGCGKTTLLRIVAGLIQSNSGTVEMSGRNVTALPVHRREIGMVFQAHALFPHMTVGENVGFGLKMRGVPKADRRKRVAAALATVRLENLIERMPHELSGGQQQRVAIARAIVIRPKVLLLDEPFGALDRKLRETLQVELREVTRSLAITSIFVTHDQEEALVLSDRIAVMNDGKIEQVAAPRTIFEQPDTRFVADFMGFANLLSAIVTESNAHELALECSSLQVAAGNDGQPRPRGQAVGIGIRQERIAMRRAGSEPARTNAIAGTVASTIYHGNLWSYRVSTPAGELRVACAPHERDQERSFEIGAAVALSWDKSAVRVFDA
jgi:spermidine/putrescine ABC transporter ATP-binding subunit